MHPSGFAIRTGRGMVVWAIDGLQAINRPGKEMTAWTRNGLHTIERPDRGMIVALEKMQQFRW